MLSLCSLIFIDSFVFFDAIRDVWEAVVVYCFLTLILDYCGGENACALIIQQHPGKDQLFLILFFILFLILFFICSESFLHPTHLLSTHDHSITTHFIYHSIVLFRYLIITDSEPILSYNIRIDKRTLDILEVFASRYVQVLSCSAAKIHSSRPFVCQIMQKVYTSVRGY